MNRNDDFTQSLEAWLRREAPSQAPDRVLNAALARVAAESQRLSWRQRLLGETRLATFMRAAALTAVIAVAMVIGLQFANLFRNVGPQPSPSASASPSATPAADCVNPPIDLMSLIEVADPVACYGSDFVTVDAEHIAGVTDCPVVVEPVWLSCPQNFLRVPGETRKVGAPMLTVAIDPAHPVSLGDANTRVQVTGHFDDPAAQTCQLIGFSGESPPPAAVTIENCRRTFVLLQAVPLEAASDRTGTITLTGGVADGPGVTVSEAIANAPTEQNLVNGWLLIDGFGTVWLCEALTESTPPLFDGARLRVEGFPDPSTPDFREADGVRWIPESIQLFGDVSVP